MSVVSSPVRSLFYCYASEDAPLRAELDKHLAMLRQLGWIQSWSDLDISAGAEWQQMRDRYLNTADLLLLLISADFIASDYCYGLAMQQALQRHQAGEAVVMPILLRPVEWEQTPLSQLQTLPRDGRAVTQWDDPDEAWKQVAVEIRKVVEALRRPVVVASPFPQQTIAAHLVSLLEAHGLPTRQAVSVPEATVLQEAVRESSAIVLVSSPETRSTHFLKEAQNLASMYQQAILDVRVVNTHQDEEQEHTPPDTWGEHISIAPEVERQQRTFQELLRRLRVLRHRSALLAITPPQVTLEQPDEPRNPYKGLRAFSSDDAGDFFGRTGLIDELTRSVETMLTLEKQGGQPARLLAIVGPSGSGKSSVVMAGLLPRLHSGAILHSDRWVYLDTLVPGAHPIDALALALFEHFPEKSLKMLRDDLQEEDARGLHLYATALARRIGNINAHVVLVVDQFEELFTLTATEQERQQFINLLVTACTQPGGSLVVILTLRADFYDRPMHYPRLCTLIAEYQALMLPMTLDDLRAVITQPAALPDVQLTFDENLVGDLLFEVQGQAGALPLLQFTLEQLFERRTGHQLTRQAYHEMGGIKGALSRHAEHTYQHLPSPEHQKSARTLFLRLIDPGITEQDTTRRRAALSEFSFADATQTRYMQETIETFIKARLLTTNQSGNRTTIEVSHEAVIREWKRLADWLREARDDIHFQQALSEDVVEWERQKQPKDRLYRGSQLKEARAWATRNTPSGSEVAFLHVSTTQQMRSRVSLVLIFFLLASLAGTTVWLGQNQSPSKTLVTTTADNGLGSLRWCIANAPDGSTITFDQRVRGMILITSGDLQFVGGQRLTIHGPGANRLTISVSNGYEFHVLANASVSVSDLSFTRQGSITIPTIVVNGGTLTLTNSIVSGNHAGSGISNNEGGTLTLINSTVSDNFGGGISNTQSTLTLTNSTVSDNSVTGNGGGIDSDSSTLQLTNSTVSGNSAKSNEMAFTNSSRDIANNSSVFQLTNSTVPDKLTNEPVVDYFSPAYGGGIFIDGGIATITFCTIYGNSASSEGGGIASRGRLMIRDSIVAANNANTASDIYGTFTSGGYNLIQNFAEASLINSQKLHVTDKEVKQLSDLHIDTTLRNNDGPTLTLALLPGSPAIDAIPPAACDLSQVPTDQRGVKRPQGSGCDIGAYEYQPPG